MRQPQVSDLYRWPGTYGWCRHGLVVILELNGVLWAEDTYWGSGSDSNRWALGDIVLSEMEFVINLNECRFTMRDEWDKYLECDRAYIPVGGGSEKYLVRRSAKPDIELTRRKLAIQIAKRKAEVRFAQRSLEMLRQELAELNAAAALAGLANEVKP